MKESRRLQSIGIAICALLLIPACATIGKTSSQAGASGDSEFIVKSVQHGIGSWYSIRTNFGTATASGEVLENHAATAAHKTLPMGTMVRVTNQVNGKSEVLRINDRGPYIKGRVIDVTIGAAERLGFRSRGIVPVKVEVLEKAGEEGSGESEA